MPSVPEPRRSFTALVQRTYIARDVRVATSSVEPMCQSPNQLPSCARSGVIPRTRQTYG
jgi:hypothetical protein